MIEAKYKAEQPQMPKPATDINNTQNIIDSENVDKNDSNLGKSQEIGGEKKGVENDEKIKNVENGAEETPKKKKKKDKQSLNAVNDDVEKSVENVELQTEKKKKKKEKKLSENHNISENYSELKDTTNNADAQIDSAKKSKKNKNKSEVKITNHDDKNGVPKTEAISIDNILTTEENGDLKKTDSQLTKKEKKEMKKKMKYQHELATVTSGVIETDNKPISKKKKRKLNDNEENEEPQQKIMKTGIYYIFLISLYNIFTLNQ